MSSLPVSGTVGKMTGLLHIFPLTSTYLQGVGTDDQSKTMAALQKLDKDCQPLLISGEELW